MAETQGGFHRRKSVGDNKGSLWSLLICLLVAVMAILALGACAEPTPTVDVAQYIEATLTSIAATSEAAATPTPTLTSTPTLTPTPTRTSTPSPTPTLSISEPIPPRGEYDYDQDDIELVETYDSLYESTYVYLKQYGRYDGFTENLYVFYEYDGRTPSIPNLIMFSLYATVYDWDYLECDTIKLILDDSTYLYPLASYDGTLKTDYIWGSLDMYLTPEEFLQIANTERVVLRICDGRFTFSDEQMEALRDLASRMQE